MGDSEDWKRKSVRNLGANPLDSGINMRAPTGLRVENLSNARLIEEHELDDLIEKLERIK